MTNEEIIEAAAEKIVKFMTDELFEDFMEVALVESQYAVKAPDVMDDTPRYEQFMEERVYPVMTQAMFKAMSTAMTKLRYFNMPNEAVVLSAGLIAWRRERTS